MLPTDLKERAQVCRWVMFAMTELEQPLMAHHQAGSHRKEAIMPTWAYIFEHPDTDPDEDRCILDRQGQRTLLVPVSDPGDVADVARRLVLDNGGELIELRGGFAPAVGNRVPVGHVTFAFDSIQAAAAYAARFSTDKK